MPAAMARVGAQAAAEEAAELKKAPGMPGLLVVNQRRKP